MQPQEETQALFKNKRDQYVVELRKKRTVAELQEKRMKFVSILDNNGNEQNNEMQLDRTNINQQLAELKFNFGEAYSNGNFELLGNILETLRRIVSFDDNPPIDALYDTGLIPLIIGLLDQSKHNCEKITMEAAWILANTASSQIKYVDYIVEQNVIPKAVSLLEHANEDIKDNAVYILSNLAGESNKYRDAIIERNGVGRLAKVLSGLTYSPSFIAHCVWLMSNLCKKPYPPFYEIVPLFEPLEKCLHIDNPEILHNVLWTFSYVTDGENSQIEEVLQMKLEKRFIELLKHEEYQVAAPCIRVIGNLVTGEDEDTRKMIEAGVIPALAALLEHHQKIFRKEAAWALSNILACSFAEIQDVYDHENGYIIKRLFDMSMNDEYDVKKECLYGIANCCSGATLSQLQILVDFGLFPILFDKLRVDEDAKIVRAVVRAIDNILEESEESLGVGNENPFLMKIVQSGGVQVIEAVQEHPDNGVYKAVSKLIDHYFMSFSG